MTRDKFLEKSILAHGLKYDYSLVEYVDENTPVKIILNDETYEQKPIKHILGNKPENIKLSVRKTTEKFIEESISIHGDKYKYHLVNYKSNREKVEIFCDLHGIFTQTPKSHLKGSNCPTCSVTISSTSRRNNDKMTTEIAVNLLKSKHGDRYEYDMVEYISPSSPIKLLCKSHGIIEKKLQEHLLYGCRECYLSIINKDKSKTNEEFIEKSKTIHSNKYGYDRVYYINSRKKVIIECYKHGYFEQIAVNHLSGMGCPKCRRSKGETFISSFLNKYNIKYEEQYRFVDCVNKKQLPFDFYLTDYNICIEFDGKQHFEGSDSMFNHNDIRDNDKIKNEYCSNNNIELLRISFKDINLIENILSDLISKYTEITQMDKNHLFIKDCLKVWGDKYDYSRVEYINRNTNVLIGYKDKFYKQTPSQHLSKRKMVEDTSQKKYTTEEFIEKSKEIWGDRFDYSKCCYISTNDYVILFDKLNKIWVKQIPKSHLNGYNPTKSLLN